MIKRLRIQFICVLMVLMAALLISLFSAVYQTTWNTMDREARKALESATFELWSISTANSEEQYPNYPCFLICVSHSGEMTTQGDAYYDLSDEAQLWEIFEEAKATGESSGILWDRELKFLRMEMWKAEEFVFTDISGMMQTMNSLYWTCMILFCVVMVVFFFISCGLARWMTRPVERALQQQRQLVADVSHELKTPLTVILTNTELLQNEAYGPEERKRFVDSISTMAAQMRGLVENLLELARMDNRQLPQEKKTVLNFSDLVEDCVMGFEPVYFESGRMLESQVQTGIFVKGNQQLLHQLVDILLDNGQKYSTKDTQVQILLTRGRSHCQLQISSRGETLTDKQCKEIFRRFYRVDPARSRDGSYGLGLSIAQGLVKEHRGKIWAQGKDGVNTFFVTLPTCDKKE